MEWRKKFTYICKRNTNKEQMKTQKDINVEFIAINSTTVANEIANQLTKSYMINEGVTEEAIYKSIAKKCNQFRFDLPKQCKRSGVQSFVESCAFDAMRGIVCNGYELTAYEQLRESVKRQAINL